MRDLDATIISQYAHSPRLLALIRSFDEAVDPETAIQDFFRTAFDVSTAQGFGLDDWGRIVGIGRTMQLPNIEGTFGFSGSGLSPFNQGTFVNQYNATNTFTLTDDAYRFLIMLKAAANTTDGTLASLNILVRRMFPDRGPVAVLHVDTMVIRYVFEFALIDYERALLLEDGVLPRPAGVGYELLEVPYPAFGFAGSGLNPFNQGTFAPGVQHAKIDEA